MPLKVHFFGSDLFSLHSLKAVTLLARRNPQLVSELTLISRKLKPTGRGQTTVLHPPVVEYAQENHIPWVEVETADEFRQLAASRPASLAIAVSYGKLIPSSYLDSLAFPGLNVHPSLLPVYRGAAPLQRAIMDRVDTTGVSVQTLHPTEFDKGQVIWQSDRIPVTNTTTFETLRDELGVLGAKGLVEVLEQERYAAPAGFEVKNGLKPSWAKRIDRAEYAIQFNERPEVLNAKGRAIGSLFFEQQLSKKRKSRVVRVILSDFETVDMNDDGTESGTIKAIGTGEDTLFGIKVNGGYLAAHTVNVAGFKKETAASYFAQQELRGLSLHANL